MKIAVKNYTFDKTAKTITFTDYASIRLDSILLIVNTTKNTIIYNFADAAKGGAVATNVLTLAYDTSAMANTDKLLIYYDDVNYDGMGSKADAASTATDATPASAISIFKQISKVLQDVWDNVTKAFYTRETYAPGYEDNTANVAKVEHRYSYQNITTQTTTTITAKFLHALTVNATANGTIIIKDGSTVIGTLKASVTEQTFLFDVALSVSLVIVTAAAPDITVSYR